MVVVIATPDDDDYYTMVVKGAPEEILKAEYEFVGDEAENLLSTVFSEQCDLGLKCISYASGKIEKATVDGMLAEGDDEDDQLEKNEAVINNLYSSTPLEYLATFGLKDEVAIESVRRPISMLRFGKYSANEKEQL